MRQPILFPPLEDIEFWETKANLVTQFDGEVFVWNPDTKHIHVFYHRDLAPSESFNCQELILTTVPSFTVSRISMSPRGKRLLLWGDKGLASVDVPQRRRANGTINCRSTVVGERFFLGHSHISAVDVQWHPGSADDVHLLVLTTDNVLRLYSAEEPACALSSYPIFDTDSLLPWMSTLNVTTGPSMLSAVSGDMVSFAIGQPLECKEGEEAEFPIYVIEENSDIYLIKITLYNKRRSPDLVGPLKVLSADDECCTSDACDLLCLPCSPPVLVIATKSGSLQHLALLEEEDSEQCLYMLEHVELEIPSSEPCDDASSVGSETDTASVTLLSDPTTRDRYFVRHVTGVHSIFLPAIARLEHFVKDDSGELNLECQCVAEHMLCVQPVNVSDPTCLFGGTVIQDAMMGTALLLLISNAEFISLPLRSVHRDTIPLLSSTKLGSPLKHSQKEKFSVQKLLERGVSNPILRCGNSSDMSQKSLLELVLKSTQVFREEYLARQCKARQEILHRMTVLQEQHSQHGTDLSELKHNLSDLNGTSADLQTTCTSVVNKQKELCKRTSEVVRGIQCLLPCLSVAETSFKDDMGEMEKKMKVLQQEADQLKQKLKFQTNTQSQLPVLSTPQQDRVKLVLKENDDKISGLVSKLKSAAAQIS